MLPNGKPTYYSIAYDWHPPKNKITEDGVTFMTDGCPDRQGKMACNRPYGSYRPGEEFRDYPFLPDASDLKIIRDEMKLSEMFKSTEGAVA